MKKNKIINWIQNNKWLLIILLVSTILRLTYLSTVPGLHNDEVSFGMETIEIIENQEIKLYGVDEHTGPLMSYLNIPIFLLFGYNVFSLRLLPTIFNIIATILIFALMNRLYNKKTGLISALLFTLIPWSVIYGRIATEISLTSFFVISSLYFFIKENKIFRLISGIIIGLACYTNLIFLVLPITYFIHFLIKDKKKIFNRTNLFFIYGFLIGFIPRVYLSLTNNINHSNILESSFLGFFSRFLSSIPHFLRILDGSPIYERFTGQILIFVIPFTSILFLLGLIYLWKKKDFFVSLFLISFIVSIIFVAPLAIRYFLIPLTFATLLMGVFLGKLKKKYASILLIIFIILSLIYLSTNFFYAFNKTGGNSHEFLCGDFQEESTDFIGKDRLFDCLVKNNATQVLDLNDKIYGDDLTITLEFYNLKKESFSLINDFDEISSNNVYLILSKKNNLTKNSSLQKKCEHLTNFEVFLINNEKE